MNRIFCLLPFLIVLAGCANPYSHFYVDYTGGVSALDNPRAIVPQSEPKLIQGTEAEKDGRRMMEDSYMLLGISNFNAAAVNQNLAIDQAKKVYADTVIVYNQYTGTLSGMMPLTTPDYQTSTFTHSGSIYGPYGGYSSYHGTSYGTTYGTKTTYIPYHIRRYDYLATFWVKAKPPKLGVYFIDLTDEIREKIESNKGVCVKVVVKGSPAFNYDIIAGDVIRKVNAEEVVDATHFKALIEQLDSTEAQTVNLEIIRNGKTLNKSIPKTW